MKTKNPKDDIANSDPANLGTLKNERAICLDKHVVPEITGDNDIMACDNYIKIAGIALDGVIPKKIEKSSLVKLFKDAVSLRSTNADVLALRIIFGARPGGNMALFFQAVALNLKDELYDAEVQKQGIFVIAAEGQVFDYSAGSFIPTSISEEFVQLYKQNVQIFHNKTDKFGAFATGDVSSVIFSFQEIFALLYDNNSDELNVFNCIKRIYKEDDFFDVKHSLLLASFKLGPLGASLVSFIGKAAAESSVELSPMALPIHFKGLYANLTHLCPPNCSRFLYPLEA